MLLEKQASPHVPSMIDLAELDLAPDDAGEPRAFRVRNLASVRLSSALVLHSSETIQALKTPGISDTQRQATEQSTLVRVLAALKPSGIQTDSPSQSFVAAVEMLVGVMEDQFLASLTDDDCQRLAAARDKLIDLIGESENHLFAPLTDFIGHLIEKYKEKFVAILAEPLDPQDALLSLGAQGLEAAYGDDEPEYTEDMLIEVNPDYKATSVESGDEQHSSGRGLEAAYGDDEPEYTEDMLIEVNPDYGKL
jgi:hypothetical protein